MSAPIAIYGPMAGQGSWPRVTRGMATGLRARGQLAGVAATDVLSHTLDDALPAFHDAPIAIHVGPPTMAMVMQSRGTHRQRLAMIAPNSSWLPANTFADLERWQAVTGYVVPSTWAETIMRRYTALPVYVYAHGVSIRPAAREVVRRAGDGYAVLHMASTHRQRKGTAELIAAWCALRREGVLPEDSRLRLVCDGPVGHFEDAIHRAAAGNPAIVASIRVSPRLELEDAEMQTFYQCHDLVCQPSRAEGFGLVPLEARAAGVPVLMTSATGHLDHVSPEDGRSAWPPSEEGVVVVSCRAESPIDDGPGAVAPTLAIEDLRAALGWAHAERDELRVRARAAAPSVRAWWSWRAVTDRFVRQYPDLFARS